MPETALSDPMQSQSDVESRIQLREDQVSRPLRFIKPTRARYDIRNTAKVDTDVDNDETALNDTTLGQAQYEWRSRDNRKGRHVLVLPPSQVAALPSTTGKMLKGIGRMFTVFAWWDISWCTAVIFSLGSAIYIVCGLFYWLPLAAPKTAFRGDSLVGGGILDFVGSVLFVVGGLLLVVEATNENQDECFG